MKTRIKTGATEPIRIQERRQRTGLTDLFVRVERGSDGFFLDWADLTFKSSGWTTKEKILAEANAANLPGAYDVVGGLDFSAITNKVANDDYTIFPLQTPGTNARLPTLGLIQEGDWVDEALFSGSPPQITARQIVRGETEPARYLIVSKETGKPLVGKTNIFIRMSRDSDGFFFDWGDWAFKSSGWTILNQVLTEVDATNEPGVYEFVDGIETSGFDAPLDLNVTLNIQVFQTGGDDDAALPIYYPIHVRTTGHHYEDNAVWFSNIVGFGGSTEWPRGSTPDKPVGSWSVVQAILAETGLARVRVLGDATLVIETDIDGLTIVGESLERSRIDFGQTYKVTDCLIQDIKVERLKSPLSMLRSTWERVWFGVDIYNEVQGVFKDCLLQGEWITQQGTLGPIPPKFFAQSQFINCSPYTESGDLGEPGVLFIHRRLHTLTFYGWTGSFFLNDNDGGVIMYADAGANIVLGSGFGSFRLHGEANLDDDSEMFVEDMRNPIPLLGRNDFLALKDA